MLVLFPVVLPGVIRMVVNPGGYSFGRLIGGIIVYGGLTYILLTLVILIVKTVMVRFSPLSSATTDVNESETEAPQIESD